MTEQQAFDALAKGVVNISYLYRTRHGKWEWYEPSTGGGEGRWHVGASLLDCIATLTKNKLWLTTSPS